MTIRNFIFLGILSISSCDRITSVDLVNQSSQELHIIRIQIPKPSTTFTDTLRVESIIKPMQSLPLGKTMGSLTPACLSGFDCIQIISPGG